MAAFDPESTDDSLVCSLPLKSSLTPSVTPSGEEKPDDLVLRFDIQSETDDDTAPDRGQPSSGVSQKIPLIAPPPMPEALGPFRVLGSFRAGQAARVFLAERVSRLGFKRHAVLKWIPKDDAAYETVRAALLDEAAALSALHHPNVVQLLDADEDEDGIYIAMEYVPGTDLRRIMRVLLERGRRISVAMACYMLARVLHGLHAAHRAVHEDGRPLGLVHRDVTPSNILIAQHGTVKITDFGIARMTERLQAETRPGMVKGKFRYLAPEYIEGGLLTFKTDIYAAGVTLFELLSGTVAFPDKNQVVVLREILGKGLPLGMLRKRGVPAPLQEVVARATARDPAGRFDSASQMAFELERWLQGSGVYLSAAVLGHTLREAGLLPTVPIGLCYRDPPKIPD